MYTFYIIQSLRKSLLTAWLPKCKGINLKKNTRFDGFLKSQPSGLASFRFDAATALVRKSCCCCPRGTSVGISKDGSTTKHCCCRHFWVAPGRAEKERERECRELESFLRPSVVRPSSIHTPFELLFLVCRSVLHSRSLARMRERKRKTSALQYFFA